MTKFNISFLASLPNISEGVKNIQAFITNGMCGNSGGVEPLYVIPTKRCEEQNEEYTVYYLRQVPSCDAAYCFGENWT